MSYHPASPGENGALRRGDVEAPPRGAVAATTTCPRKTFFAFLCPYSFHIVITHGTDTACDIAAPVFDSWQCFKLQWVAGFGTGVPRRSASAGRGGRSGIPSAGTPEVNPWHWCRGHERKSFDSEKASDTWLVLL